MRCELCRRKTDTYYSFDNGLFCGICIQNVSGGYNSYGNAYANLTDEDLAYLFPYCAPQEPRLMEVKLEELHCKNISDFAHHVLLSKVNSNFENLVEVSKTRRMSVEIFE